MDNRNYASDSLYTNREQFLVVLDSRNATTIYNPPYNSYVTFEFEDPIMIPKDALSMNCSVLSFVTPNSIYNINETNQYFHIQYSIVGQPTFLADLSFKIPVGNYTSTTFMSQLTTEVNGYDPTFGPGFSITINNLNNQFTMYNPSYIFWFMPDSTIYNVMGFPQNQTIYSNSVYINAGTQTTNAVQSLYTCNFNGIQNINIHFETCVTSNIDSYSKSKSSIIASVPIDANKSQIYYVKTHDYSFAIKDDVIDKLIISLQDDLENHINFNNQHWNMSLVFSVISDISRFQYENNFHTILKNGYYYR